mmetsp:Transcript_8183/g.29784  ORF Transcript_8183/g.29784 Transcript_8183/m.29784 type:complete len:282 (-) Transcript_8183:2-847(-)
MGTPIGSVHSPVGTTHWEVALSISCAPLSSRSSPPSPSALGPRSLDGSDPRRPALQRVDGLPAQLPLLLLLLLLRVDAHAQAGVVVLDRLRLRRPQGRGCAEGARGGGGGGGCEAPLHIGSLPSGLGCLGRGNLLAEELADGQHAVRREEAGGALLPRLGALRGQCRLLGGRRCGRHLAHLTFHAVRISEQLRIQRRHRPRRCGDQGAGLLLLRPLGGRAPRGLHHLADGLGLIGVVVRASAGRGRSEESKPDHEAHHGCGALQGSCCNVPVQAEQVRSLA